jgi:hypothetical protein
MLKKGTGSDRTFGFVAMVLRRLEVPVPFFNGHKLSASVETPRKTIVVSWLICLLSARSVFRQPSATGCR